MRKHSSSFLHRSARRRSSRSTGALACAAALVAVASAARSVRATELEPPDPLDCISMTSILAEAELEYFCEGGGPGGGGGGEEETAHTDTGGGGGHSCPKPEDMIWNHTAYPVDVRFGAKLETETDLSIRLPGRDYSIVRRHASNLTADGDRPNYIGTGWTLNNFSRLRRIEDISGPDWAYLVTGDNTRVRFDEDPSSADDFLSPPGSRLLLFYSGSSLPGVAGMPSPAATYFQLVEPGVGTRYYEPETGRLLREVDVAGNVIEHIYAASSVSFSRPDHVFFFTKAEAAATWSRPSAILNINYTNFPSEGPEQYVSLLQVIRPIERVPATPGSASEAQQDAEEYVVAQEVRYTYFDDAPIGKSSDLGLTGDLVQVERFELTNAGLLAAENADLGDVLGEGARKRLTFEVVAELLKEGTDGANHNPLYELAYQFEMAKESDARRRVTQYRYYTTSGVSTDGTFGQIKMVFAPEQLEHFHIHSGDDPVELLELDDDDLAGLPSPFNSHEVADIASKRISYYPEGDDFEYAVQEEIILASCGCSGSSAVGKRIAYSYLDDTVAGKQAPDPSYGTYGTKGIARTVTSTEYVREGTVGSYTETPHRRVRYDLIDIATELGGAEDPQYRTVYRTIFPLTGTVGSEVEGDPWVWRRDYYLTSSSAGDVGQMQREYEPSSFAKHWTDASSNADELTADGLVRHYAYYDDSDYRYAQVKSVSVSEASDGTFASEALIEEYDYENDELRSDLVKKVIRHRATTTSSALSATIASGNTADIEITEYETYYWDAGNSEWDPGLLASAYDRRDEKTEVEPEAENGRSDVTFYRTVTIYDEHDQVETVARADSHASITDGSRTDYTYDQVHGEVVRVVDRTLPGSGDAWDASAEPGAAADKRVTQLGYDVDGRLITVIEPTGAVSNTWRIMEDWIGDGATPATERFAVLTLPPVANTTGPVYAGPIATEYLSASDKSLGSRRHATSRVTRDGDGDPDLYNGTDPPFARGTELARTALARNLSGLVTHATRYDDVTDSTPVAITTEYVYDGLGRLRVVRKANDTVMRYTYDTLDRLIKEEIGVIDSGSSSTDEAKDFVGAGTGGLVATAEYFFDWDGSGSPAQGIGNGNLRVLRQHVEGSGHRDTEFWYDFRDREVASLGAENESSDSNGAVRETKAYDNLGRVTVVERFDAGDGPDFSGGVKGWREEMKFNQRGLPYRRLVSTSPTTGGNFLVWNTWYDQQGRVIAEEAPTAPAMKTAYDVLGRMTATYTTDRGGDDAAGTTGNWLDAIDLTGDNVLEQTELTYRVEGSSSATDQVALQTTRLRAHENLSGSLATGDLASATTSHVVNTFSGVLYDEAGRPIRMLEYGSNSSNDRFEQGTSAPTLPGSIDPSATTASPLVTAISYSDRGLVGEVEAPDESVTAIVYDDLGRRVGVIENASGTRTVDRDTDSTPWKAVKVGGGALTPWDPDDDRITIFIYDGVDNLTHRIAVNYQAKAASGTGSTPAVYEQVTEYVYGVSDSAGFVSSKLDSNDLLAKAIYPDEKDGDDPTPGVNGMEYAYNRLGELIAIKDQNGTQHAYTRDAQGRVTLDLVSAWGDAADLGGESPDDPATPRTIDQTVDRLAFTYDKLGRLATAKSLDGATVINAVAYEHNDTIGGGGAVTGYVNPWLLQDYTQNPAGDLAATHERSVTYAYTTSSSNGSTGLSGTHQRASTIKYPSGGSGRTTLTMDYGSGVDATISRAVGFDWGTGRGVEYAYLGVQTPVTKRYEENGVMLDRFVDASAATTGAARSTGVYHGLDRYGRVKRQVWYKPPSGAAWIGGAAYASGGRPAIVDFGYTYDNASDIITRIDERGDAKASDRDERYSYDGLNRLVEAKRGVDNGTSITIGGNRSQRWTLDLLGNQEEVITDTQSATGTFTAGTDLTLTRIYNLVNEAVDQESEENSSATAEDVRFDAAGNQLEDDAKEYTFDAWNRLVAVSVGGKERAEYTYYPMHQRATRKADTTYTESPIVFDEHDLFYYDAAWRLFEERRFGADAFTGDADDIVQRLWGLTYIDEYLGQMIDRTSGGAPDGDMTTGTVSRHYAVTDRRHDVVAMLGVSGVPVEWIRYTAYGVAQVRKAADVTGTPGAIDGSDLGLIVGTDGNDYGDPAYDIVLDINLDGQIDFGTDGGLLLGAWGAYDAAEGKVSTIGNSIAYAGYVYDEAVDLYCVRFRWYSATGSNWLARDPIGYVDGSSLYTYLGRQGPMRYADPYGLQKLSPEEEKCFQDRLARSRDCINRAERDRARANNEKWAAYNAMRDRRCQQFAFARPAFLYTARGGTSNPLGNTLFGGVLMSGLRDYGAWAVGMVAGDTIGPKTAASTAALALAVGGAVAGYDIIDGARSNDPNRLQGGLLGAGSAAAAATVVAVSAIKLGATAALASTGVGLGALAVGYTVAYGASLAAVSVDNYTNGNLSAVEAINLRTTCLRNFGRWNRARQQESDAASQRAKCYGEYYKTHQEYNRRRFGV